MSFALRTKDGRQVGYLLLSGGPKSGDCTFRSFPEERGDLDLPESEYLTELEQQGELRWKDAGEGRFRIEDTSAELVGERDGDELTSARFSFILKPLPSGIVIGEPVYSIEMKIVVSSMDKDRQVRFKGAVGHGGGLDLVESTTPYELQFSAKRVIALFESLDTDRSIMVELFGDFGQPNAADKPVSSFWGRGGGIGQDVQSDRSIGAGQIYF